MSLTGKTIASTYKSLIKVSDETNGITGAASAITDGNGTQSSISMSYNSVVVIPRVSDHAGVFVVSNKAGTGLFNVNTTSNVVSAGTGGAQQILNTQYAYFGVSSSDTQWAAQSANTHYAVPFGSCNTPIETIANFALGTITDPATTPVVISDTAHDIVKAYWFIPDNITVKDVKWWVAGDASTGDTIRAHLMSYTVDDDNGATSGDLSSGTVVASSSDIVSAGNEQIYYNSMSIDSADVDAGEVILFVFRGDGVNSDYTINATVKYHLR